MGVTLCEEVPSREGEVEALQNAPRGSGCGYTDRFDNW